MALLKTTVMTSAKIVFTPSGKRGEFPLGTKVLDAARSLGVDVDSVCGGRGLCGRCQVVPMVGEFSKHNITCNASHISDATKMEARYQRINGEFAQSRRLSCQMELKGDLVVDVPADSQVHRQVIRKDADAMDIAINPAIRMHVVDVREPDMHDPSGDFRRLCEALKSEWELTGLTADLNFMHGLQKVLREGNWQVTVAVFDEREILAVWPGFKQDVYGIAIDVGSTTIAGHLTNLITGEVAASSGAMNPQIRFGEDLMSRVSYVMMNPGGDKDMTDAVRTAINELLVDVSEKASITPNDILDITFVANPVMHHLLLGINPVELGYAPFALTTDEAMTINASELDLVAHPRAKTYLLPCIAGHVGADTAGVILAEAPGEQTAMTLLVDVGTNAEIVLGNKDRLLACSSPTGPAFEGAQISGGQRAAPGAIERVRIDRDTLEPRFRVIGSELWSNEPGFAESIEGIGVTGICGSGIIEVVAEMFLAGVIDHDGVVQGELAAKSDRIEADDRTFSYRLFNSAEFESLVPGTDEATQTRATNDSVIDPVDRAANNEDAADSGSDNSNNDGNQTMGVNIRITQNDVRQIQLAKAALYAGVRLLMDRLEINSVERIRLAGAFGSHIDVTYAMVLGLIPDCQLNEVASAGNAAGNGARIALLDKSSRAAIEQTVRNVEKIETAIEPAFQDHFVEAMAFPHKTADFTELAKVIELPPRPAVSSSEEGRSKRRGRAARRRARPRDE